MADELQKYYFARELSDNGLYDTAASVFENFLQGKGCAADKTDACRALAFCYKQQGKRSQQLSALLRSVEFAPPRAERYGRLFCGRRTLGSGDLLVQTRPADRRKDGVRLPRLQRVSPLHLALRVLRQARRS